MKLLVFIIIPFLNFLYGVCMCEMFIEFIQYMSDRYGNTLITNYVFVLHIIYANEFLGGCTIHAKRNFNGKLYINMQVDRETQSRISCNKNWVN